MPMNFSRIALASAMLAALLTGCSMTPNFVQAPPPSYRVPLPPEIQGVWAREGKDNGERARITALGDGTVRVDLFKTRPSAEDKPQAPVFVQALRFDDTDWLLVDLRELAAREGAKYPGDAPYKLIKYVMENDNRLCGILPSASRFAQAIKAGQLQGSVKTYVEPMINVTVTSPGAEWVKWWSELPSSDKMFAQPVFCFQRVN
ncbi:MAG: hypothetical protein ACM3PQ_00080 [Methanosarcina sp.]